MDKHDTEKEQKEQHNPQVGKSMPDVDQVSSPPGRHAQARMQLSDAEHEADMHGEGFGGAMDNAMTTTQRAGSGMVGGVAHVATDLVHGVGAVSGEVVTVVRDTANNAIAGVGSIGETAVHTITGLLADIVGGLRDIGSAAMNGRGSGARGNAERHEETMH